MNFEKVEDFYELYALHRTYVRAEARKKHVRNFDEQFWRPAEVNSGHSVLELGTGTGLFLSYLLAKGIEDFHGVELDEKVLEYMPSEISQNVTIGNIWDYIGGIDRRYDRIVMFDVFEHFSYFEGCKLLTQLREKLEPTGRIVLRIPNAASPWGQQYQYNDLTHKAVYGPGSIEHLALAAGFKLHRRLSARRGNPFKRFLEDMLHLFLNKILTEPPPLWGANMVIVLAPREPA